MPEKRNDTYVIEMSQPAKRDLAEISRYIAQDNPLIAKKVKNRIVAKIATLDHFPYRGSYVPALLDRNVKEYRQISVPPWKIIYKVEGKKVQILTIIDSRRDLQDILIKKFLKS